MQGHCAGRGGSTAKRGDAADAPSRGNPNRASSEHAKAAPGVVAKALRQACRFAPSPAPRRPSRPTVHRKYDRCTRENKVNRPNQSSRMKVTFMLTRYSTILPFLMITF